MGLTTFLYTNNKMEVELLEEIVKNTEHKTSFQIIVSDNKSSFNTRFNQKLDWIGIKYTK